MPSKSIIHNDLIVTLSAGMFGGDVKVRVTCRKYDQTMTQDEFMALIYPLFDKKANE